MDAGNMRFHNVQTARNLWLAGLLLLGSATAIAADAASTQMIVRDGHKIAFHVTPGHLPVIVLDAGGGLDSSYWNTLVPELARKTGSKIITYDRAGFGASDEVKGPWDVMSATADLTNGLKVLGATRDVILVSHSIAGEIATYLVREHPDWISGAVLVDANIPDFFTDQQTSRMIKMYIPVIAAAKAAPPTNASRQLLAVADSFPETSHAFHKTSWPPSVPVIVIVSETTPFETPEDAQAWRDSHREFAARAENRQLRVAEKSSHDVAHDRPDVILRAITDTIAGKR
jgi:pimeloyl-ACP methyl ester carboxylesterase